MSKNIQRKIKQNPKHILARLREVIGGSQKNASDDLGIATDTCASIESGKKGRARLTPTIARRIESWTGVSGECLLKDSNKLTTPDGKPYNHDVYLQVQADKRKDSLDWSNPANLNFYRLTCLEQFRTLVSKLAALMLAAHTSRRLGFIDAKLDNEMRRLAKLLRQEGRTLRFESLAGKQTENMDAESEAGLVAVFNQFKKELPPARSLDEYLKVPTATREKQGPCPKCQGKGGIFCPKCHADAEWISPLTGEREIRKQILTNEKTGKQVNCKKCKNRRNIDCPACKGKGRV